MREIAKLGLALFLVCAVSAGVLAYVNSLTEPIILDRRSAEKAQGLARVLPDADSFEDASEQLEVLAGRTGVEAVSGLDIGLRGDQLAGAVYTVEPLGYTQEIVILVGISAGGRVQGIQILDHLETPGLGSRIEERWFLDLFLGLEAGTQYLITKDGGTIDTISGATVSVRAVTEGVNQALRAHVVLFAGQ